MKKNLKNLYLLLIFAAAFLSSQCLGVEANDELPFTAQYNTLINPESGWYRSMETHNASPGELMEYRKAVSLVALETDLGDYINRELDTKKLTEIDNAFSYARRAGLSVIFRAAYSFNEVFNCDPKDIKIILRHVDQLSDIFYKYEDILFNVQAGFFGPWGEWHSSNYSEGGIWTKVKPEYQKMLVNALLEAVPPGTTIALRRPEYIRTVAGTKSLSEMEAFSDLPLARLSFHNDALMSEKTDMDTYIDPDFQPVEKEFEWINNHSSWTPFIGETNKLSKYNDLKYAVEFLDLMNAHSLNIEYHPGVLRKWNNSRYNNMNGFDYIGSKLGYHFELREVNIQEQAEADGLMNIELKIMNTGFSRLLREKIFELVLIKENIIIKANINEDARFWNKNELVDKTFIFHLPENISSGNWDVYLGLRSPYETIANNPAYSVRFTNAEIWHTELGLNKVGGVNIKGGAEEESIKETDFFQIGP